MKKRIAIFGNGWSDEFVSTVMKGIRKAAQEIGVDVFAFLDFAVPAIEDGESLGDINIMRLPDFSDFDGVLLLGNTFNMDQLKDYLLEQIAVTHIPAISLEYEFEGIDYIGTENYGGMYELVEHLITVHGVKDIMFMGGVCEHPESIVRLKATRDAMEEHGLHLDEDHVTYGYFSDLSSQAVMKKWIQDHGKMPEAVVCANDIMAMGVCLWLSNNGYDVPRDVIVTGYDCIESARECKPSITTVGRDWDNLGYLALQQLVDKVCGKEVQPKKTIASKIVVGESCGCDPSQFGQESHRNIRFTNYGKKRENMDFDIHNRELYRTIRKVRTKKDAFEMFRQFYEHDHSFEGDNYCMCLVDQFFESADEQVQLPKNGYSDYMHVVACIHDGQVQQQTQRITTKQLIPFYNGDESEPAHIYILVALHSNTDSLGYAVFGDKEDILENYKLYSWTRHINQYLEQIILNIQLATLNERLTDLSVTDGLTGIYNRMGYEKIAIPYLERCRREGRLGVMMLADINKMKLINDNYGHLQGDNAICAVASALKKSLPMDWVVVRYGGDEFLAAGSCESKDQVKQLEIGIHETLKQEVETREIPFHLSVSIGVAWVDDEVTLNMEECFKRADESMYIIKEEKHKEM